MLHTVGGDHRGAAHPPTPHQEPPSHHHHHRPEGIFTEDTQAPSSNRSNERPTPNEPRRVSITPGHESIGMMGFQGQAPSISDRSNTSNPFTRGFEPQRRVLEKQDTSLTTCS